MVITTETHVICNKQLNKHINMATTTETHVICNITTTTKQTNPPLTYT